MTLGQPHPAPEEVELRAFRRVLPVDEEDDDLVRPQRVVQLGRSLPECIIGDSPGGSSPAEESSHAVGRVVQCYRVHVVTLRCQIGTRHLPRPLVRREEDRAVSPLEGGIEMLQTGDLAETVKR